MSKTFASYFSISKAPTFITERYISIIDTNSYNSKTVISFFPITCQQSNNAFTRFCMQTYKAIGSIEVMVYTFTSHSSISIMWAGWWTHWTIKEGCFIAKATPAYTKYRTTTLTKEGLSACNSIWELCRQNIILISISMQLTFIPQSSLPTGYSGSTVIPSIIT